MPLANQVSHRNIQNLALPYKSYVSPTESEVFYCSGSSNLLTSIKSSIERRPGFATSLEASPTQFTNPQRIFTWNRWDGTFIYMVNDISGGNSIVYKMVSGTDANFVALFTDTGNTNPFSFVVSNNTLYFANGHVNRKWNPAIGVQNWGITAPAAAPTLGSNAGTAINLQVGWKYVYCYGNSATGHLSSPSPISASTGTVTVLDITVDVVASADTQVDQIRVFRTTDGGGGNYFEITGSPFTNVSATLTDSTADASLSIITAPTPTFNDPPPVWNFMTYWNGRIWGVDAAKNNTIWMTGEEEITIGVLEESIPSGVAGNFWTFDQQVIGLTSLPGCLLVTCPGRQYTITGNSLDTYRRDLLSNRRGSREWATFTTLGGMAMWRDTSSQIWGTDGSSLQEIGTDIRTDLQNFGVTGTSMTAHIEDEWHWLVFSSGTQIFVYDMDLGQWMPPWNVAATYIYSGEIAAGYYVLLAAISGKIYYLTSGSFNDRGTPYAWQMYTSLLSMVPDFGKRFSFIAQGSYDQPSRLGKPWMWAFDGDRAVESVKILVDDDPTQSSSWAGAIDITANLATPEQALLRKQGTNLLQETYPMAGAQVESARRVAINMTGAIEDHEQKIYSMFLAYGEQR